MKPLSRGIILSITPRANIALVDEIVVNLPKLGPVYGLKTHDEQLQFLAQAIHESNGLTSFTENLNYSTPQRIAAVWPSRFNITTARPYARNPAGLANRVYANRMGNGPETSGDGWKYRGRGMLQGTGKAMYARISKETGVDFVSNPDLLLTPKYNLLGALAIARILNLGAIHDFRSDTKTLNGGYTNYDHRESLYKRLQQLTA
jgi:putative chitinase